MISAAPAQAPDTFPTTVAPYVAPPSSIAPPTAATGDPVILDRPLFRPAPSPPSPIPLYGGTQSDPLDPTKGTTSGPSIGYGYTPPARTSLTVPSSASDTTPTTLPTVTTWASSLPAHWQAIAAVVLAIILLVVYRRRRG